MDGLKIDGYFKLTWMKVRLLKMKFPDGKDKIKKIESKDEDEERKFDFKQIKQIISLIYESSPHLMRIFKAFLKSTTFKKFHVKLVFGFGSPYDTALISGYFYALIPLLNLIPKSCFFFQPHFQEEQLEANINLEIQIRLLRIVIELLRAFTKKPVRELLKELRKMR